MSYPWYQKDFRIWDGKNMIFFSIGDVMDNGLEVIEYYDREMQWTGILDKHEKPIYECDILLSNHNKKFEVDFFRGQYGIRSQEKFYGKYWHGNLCELMENGLVFEVIGNIYENKDLLDTV